MKLLFPENFQLESGRNLSGIVKRGDCLWIGAKKRADMIWKHVHQLMTDRRDNAAVLKYGDARHAVRIGFRDAVTMGNDGDIRHDNQVPGHERDINM